MSEPVHLRESLRAAGTPAFEETLREELLRNNWGVPLEDFCPLEAWPGFDVDLRLSVHQLEESADNLRVKAFVSFTGRVPSYCADQAHTVPADGFLRITIDRATAEASFETDPLGA
ncbi:hypothetical protein AN478_11235 [Thiohalorhabdus denitrificans]|uniref:Uncharacterized protein n=1 Tax=Thiohalorhabdus denitrificans TaxID=381306 RepID=A0A0P9C950_9GAMM|nr:hypothetical protein [Thiohalorhabdus denitrificans]KPV39680.1 hypothetical protein AN478_11235 [Thiohalorhabdus denitrificans]SCX94231.1 hypothetical protein SAMN05661077_0786 [Thiohalorhabdus denitrificans]